MPAFLCTMTAFVIVFLRNWAWVLMENGWKMNGGNTIINHCFYSWSDPFSLVWYHKWCATASFPQFGLHYFNLDTDYSLLTGKIFFETGWLIITWHNIWWYEEWYPRDDYEESRGQVISDDIRHDVTLKVLKKARFSFFLYSFFCRIRNN